MPAPNPMSMHVKVRSRVHYLLIYCMSFTNTRLAWHHSACMSSLLLVHQSLCIRIPHTLI